MRSEYPSMAAALVPYAAVATGLFVLRSAWAAILLYHLGIVVVLSVTGWRSPLLRAQSGWRWFALPAAVTAALAGAGLYLLWPYIDATGAGLDARLREFGLGGASWLLFAVYYSTVHPVLEELFWRGGGDGARRPAPDWRDVAFAGYHVPVLWFFVGPVWVAVSFFALAAASWLWRLAAHRFGGLGVPLVSHAAADLSIMVAAMLIARHGPW
jgi:hypothetical protein